MDKELKEAVSIYVAGNSSCPYCGRVIFDSIEKAFLAGAQYQASLGDDLISAVEDLITANGWTGSHTSVDANQPHIYKRMQDLSDALAKWRGEG